MKILYTACFVLFTLNFTYSQTYNWDFETWTSNVGYDNLTGWENINQYAAILGVSPSVEKITSGVPQGMFAAKLTTNTCANCSAIIGPRTDTLAGLINQSRPYTSVPQTATFMYKYSGVGGDMGLFYIEVTAWDAVGDSAIIVAAGADTLLSVNSWTTKSVPFYPGPGVALTPDSIKVSFLSSAGALDIGTAIPQVGSELSVDALSLDTQVSINEAAKEELKLEMFNGFLSVAFESDNAQVELIDLTGKVLDIEQVNSQVIFNISQYPKGIYLIRYSSDNGVLTKKIFIQ